MRGLALGCILLVASSRQLLADDPYELTDLAILGGCWVGQVDGKIVAERWDAPSGNTMLGTSKTVAGEETVQVEFLQIAGSGSKISYTPYIDGKELPAFHLTVVDTADGLVRFENPRNSFPSSIQYQRTGDALAIRLSGNDGSEFSYTLQRKPCE